MNKSARSYFNRLSYCDKRKLAIVALERLIEMEEVRFRLDDSVHVDGTPIDPDDVVEECFYWTGCGENLLGETE